MSLARLDRRTKNYSLDSIQGYNKVVTTRIVDTLRILNSPCLSIVGHSIQSKDSCRIREVQKFALPARRQARPKALFRALQLRLEFLFKHSVERRLREIVLKEIWKVAHWKISRFNAHRQALDNSESFEQMDATALIKMKTSCKVHTRLYSLSAEHPVGMDDAMTSHLLGEPRQPQPMVYPKGSDKDTTTWMCMH